MYEEGWDGVAPRYKIGQFVITTIESEHKETKLKIKNQVLGVITSIRGRQQYASLSYDWQRSFVYGISLKMTSQSVFAEVDEENLIPADTIILADPDIIIPK